MRAARRLALSLATGLVAVALSSPARAEDKASFAATVFVSLTLGQVPAVGFGADLRMAGLVQGSADACDTDERVGLGPFVQAAILLPRGVRLSAGGHGGGELVADHQSFSQAGPTYALDGEVGWTWRSALGASPGGHGVLLGLQHLVFPASVAVRASVSSYDGWLAPEGSFALGVGYPQLFGERPGSQCLQPIQARPVAPRGGPHQR